MFSRDTAKKELEAISTTRTTLENTQNPGENTICFNFEIKTNLGWIAWKDREAALYSLFERAFAATRCEFKISDSLDTYSMEIEIPADQEEKFQKAVKGKTLAREIDKMHKIEPALCPWVDAKLVNIRKSSGSTHVTVNTLSSVEVLQRRIENLEKCSSQRSREVAAIKDLSVSIMEEMEKKLDSLVKNIDMKVYEKCGSKFDAAEYRIMKVLRDELSFLATPSAFNHPEGVERIDSGAQVFLNSLHTVNLKRREQEIDLAKSKNDYLIQSKFVATKGLVKPLTPQSPTKSISEQEKSQSMPSPQAVQNSKSLAATKPTSDIEHVSNPIVNIPINNLDELPPRPPITELVGDVQMEKIDDLIALSEPELPEKSAL